MCYKDCSLASSLLTLHNTQLDYGKIALLLVRPYKDAGILRKYFRTYCQLRLSPEYE